MRIFDVDQIAPNESAAAADHLLPDEQVRAAFRSATTTILFTERRILTVQLHTLLNERLETSSFSYRSVRHFSILQSAGAEGRTEVRIWIGADPQPLHLRANAGTELAALQRLLAEQMA